ncbi:MAG TPA: LysM peptidoglycan-binding domain-containing protein [Gemmatimonadales bacterium]|nr:LysM peptidoglycan-binding domain-containing protein [Gemmatimonadales bacterium]
MRPAPAPAAQPAPARPVADTALRPAPVPLADSIALARQARDSALDAAILDKLATAKPPETPDAPAGGAPEAESASLRTMFDIDVVNWADHNRVKYYLDFFTGPAHERMAIWLQRMPRYEPTIRSQLIAHGLPGDLAYLPLIESGYSSTAVSRARAVGMWQFIRGTGKLYGLKIDDWVDERRDVVKATNAAIRYLGDLTTRFGSPYLAAAAYNGGPGRIQRGLARIDPADEVDDSIADDSDAPQAGDAAFFQLADTRYIRRETKDYVPKLIAAALIAKRPELYGFPAVATLTTQPDDSVIVNEATGLDVVARLAGVSLADLWAANPSYVRAVTPPNRRAVVRVPAGAGGSTQLALNELPNAERLTSFAHHARKGETLARIARRYGVSLGALRGFNTEYASRAPRPGEVVRIPGQARLVGWIGEDRRVAEPAASGSLHRVARGETLGGLAARYHVSIARLRSWNGLGSSAKLRVGQLLRVRAGSAAASSRKAAAAKVHVVRAGETLTSVARRYKVTLQSLRSANGLPAGRPLQAGQRLTIPS